MSVDETEIVAAEKTFVEADKAAKKSGKDYFLTKTPDSWIPRILSTV